MATLSEAQRNMLWLIKDTGDVHIPHYRLNQKRTAESLRREGLVEIKVSGGGTWIVGLRADVEVR
jgi:hypothetical protein